MFGFALKPQQSVPEHTISRTDSCITRCPVSRAGRKSNLSFLPFIFSMNGVRFAELDVELTHRFTELRGIAGTIGLILVAEVHSGPANAVIQTPEGMNDKLLVDWYVENDAMISVSRFVKDSPW
ncbi:TPA: hypothetical protein QHC19_003520 [Raoultella ornithinolytica]|nr:hypothetical protein [Raoultella ornithinolytica]HDT6018628.1 hypothetical protein [Raoultella ornithinolytica]